MEDTTYEQLQRQHADEINQFKVISAKHFKHILLHNKNKYILGKLITITYYDLILFLFRTNFAIWDPILNQYSRRIGVSIHNSKIFSNSKQA